MDLSHLNPPQRQAVTTTEGPLLVLAGAGSGKTRVITHRIAYLLQEKMIAARNILAVTFTNKAAQEMKERVVHMVGKKASQVLISTFHSFGAEVLKEDIHRLGYPKKFAIADMGDQLALIKRAMREKRIDDREFDARKVLTAISRAKNAGVIPEPKAEGQGDDYDLITHLVVPVYQLGLRAMGAVDFDDLIVLPSQLFREHPQTKQKYLRRFRYVLVDEFQDTNHAQLELLTLIAGESRNVCAVGDDDQCIYGWRGAEVQNILQYDRFFPGAAEVRLEQNYRSTRTILEAANAVIEKNPERKAKRMWTDGVQGERISVVVLPSEEEEARWVAREIHRQVEIEGVPADEIAVLYRTNGQAHPVEEALREKSLYYEVVGGSEFFDRREVKDVLELHALNNDDYYLGIFLVGAYQEILGDLHNLFGDTHAVGVSIAPNGGYLIDHVVEGDTVTEVLNYVSYNKDDLVARVRKSTEQALRAGRLTLDESRKLLRMYEQGLAGYTYLEREVDAKFYSQSGQLRLVTPGDGEQAGGGDSRRTADV